MKYHGCEIIIIPADLGEERPQDNRLYQIYKDGKFINEALTLDTAKVYIDEDFNDTYL